MHALGQAVSEVIALSDIVEIFSLDVGQISSNLVKKAFAAGQNAFLSPIFVFYNIFAQVCTEIKSDLHLYAFVFFLIFFYLSFFSFSSLFAEVIDLLLGLLPFGKFLGKH